jgi:hypothetical protein
MRTTFFMIAVVSMIATGTAYAATAQSVEVTCGFSSNCTLTCPHYTLFTLILGSKSGGALQIADCSAVENDGSIRYTCDGDRSGISTVAPGMGFPLVGGAFGRGSCCALTNTSSAGSCSIRITCNGCVVSDAASVKVIW